MHRRILYKYTTIQSAQKILAACTLKFSHLSLFNDAFEGRIPLDFKERGLVEDLDRFRKSFLDYIVDSDDHRCTNNPYLNMLKEMFLNLCDQEKKKFILKYNETDTSEMYSLKHVGASIKKAYLELQQSVDDHAVICFSDCWSRNVMWGNYSSNHQGVVFGFFPSVEKDSWMLSAKKVIYADKKLNGFSDVFLSNDERNKRIDELILTKHTEWKHEREYRVAIYGKWPSKVKETFYSFYAEELVSVTFGLRTSNSVIDQISKLSRVVNPNIKLYKVVLDSAEAKLNRHSI